MTEAGPQARQMSSPNFATIVLVLGPFSFGYFLSYLLRAVNAVVAPELNSELGLNASALGQLTAAYLLTFALVQLPLGVALDRYGPRRAQTLLIAIAAAGAFLFAIGDDLATLTLARALIGLGFAGGLMAGFKAVTIWIRPERHALANAWVMSAGAVGLLVATAPTEYAVQIVGWRGVFYVFAALTALCALIIWSVVPERPNKEARGETLGGQLSGLGRIVRDRVFWALAPLLALTAGTQIAVQTLWAGPWLRDVAGLSATGAADVLFVAAVAFLFGVLFSGGIADRLQRRGISLLTTYLVFTLLFLAAQVTIVAQYLEWNIVSWFVFGMTGQTAVLAYPWLAQYFGQGLAGRSNAAINLTLFIAAFAIQYAIGLIIDLYPQGADGSYPPEAYQVSFGTFLALQMLAIIWYMLNARLIRAAERKIREL